MADYVIRPATVDDTDAMIALRAEAERWLADHGIRQWTADYGSYARDALRRAVVDGAAWVIEFNGRVIATVSVSTEADPDFWQPEDQLQSALYLSKMIVSVDQRGQGIAEAIMNWASQRAAAAGKRWIRIDVRRDNMRLQSYYLSRGFQHVRTGHAWGRRTESGWLAQRPAGLVTPTTVELAAVAGDLASAPVGAVRDSEPEAQSSC